MLETDPKSGGPPSPDQVSRRGFRQWAKRDPVKRRAKVSALALVLAVVAFVLGAATFALATTVRGGPIFCGPDNHVCAGMRPYLQLVLFAGLFRAGVAVWRRPWSYRREKGYLDEVSEGIVDAARGSVMLVVFTFFFRSGTRFRGFSYSRLVFFLDWIFATVVLVALAVAMKAILMRARRNGHHQRNVVIVGPASQIHRMERLVARHPELGYCIVGRIEQNNGHAEASQVQQAVLELARDRRIDEVILVLTQLNKKQLAELVGAAELARIEIKAVPEMFGLPPRKVQLGSVGPLPVLQLLQEPLSGPRRAIKRTMDVVLGSVLLAVASPIMLVVAILVKLSSEGPVIFKQERVGMDGRPFQFLKFRTMYVNQDPTIHRDYVAAAIRGDEVAPQNGEIFKLVDDPRVTPVGRWLRRLSLDELPQLVNVLRGEMSLVGPRPSLPFEVALYEDWHRWRLEVRPGMTGLWQVSGRSLIRFEDMVRLDIEYIERWSPLRDLLILIRTVPALFRGETG
jgi:exopolysaccharide biosynthesis polyprenyl glycosylphosphotransferase